MRRHLQGLCLLGSMLLVGCMDDVSPEPVTARVSADPALCAEHGVLESVCPKCNPRLAVVFEGSGDWCDEHGFPESFCPICSPEKGGRPDIQPVATDGAPADGTVVRFRTRSAAEQAGLAVVFAEETDWVAGTEAVARITWDATRVAAISPRASGVVRAIRAESGDRVERGQVLAEISSAHVAGDRSRLVTATRVREVAMDEVTRQATLLERGVASQRDLLVAQEALAVAETGVAVVQAELDLVGSGSGSTAIVRTPIAGIVTVRHVRVGQTVDGVRPIFEVVDTSQMWAEIDVPERDLAGVAPGQEVRLRLDALPDEVFVGTIASLSPAVDPLTRTAQARVVLDNPDGRLRANLYGVATILDATAVSAVSVPAEAVQRAGDSQLVFVRQQVDSYTARRVRVLARQGDQVRISGGVKAGDAVVTTGSFLLKTETLKDSIGAGCCDVE
ncbi:MAG: cobalt-zinc-cadmium efflux system membrane fusion protein [Myxococcota bacterium]|jgi:cobalt-zinc-cadmium efflux system membrane fusion protein